MYLKLLYRSYVSITGGVGWISSTMVNRGRSPAPASFRCSANGSGIISISPRYASSGCRLSWRARHILSIVVKCIVFNSRSYLGVVSPLCVAGCQAIARGMEIPFLHDARRTRRTRQDASSALCCTARPLSAGTCGSSDYFLFVIHTI